MSVLAYQDMEGLVAYGMRSGAYTLQTPVRRFKKGEPVELVIGALQANTPYYYQFRWRATDTGQFTDSEEYAFHTARPPGGSFTFTMTADSHLDENASPKLYRRTLANALADSPDFHIDLGDTFMTEKHPSRESAARQYLAQRFYFGQLCQSAPLFLVPGNHDGESPRGRGSDADSLAVWSNTMRKRYFTNPAPDGFYVGNGTKDPLAGLLQDYYAWTWGDALFVVLDAYWYSTTRRGDERWGLTLGDEQYKWLKLTLEQSKAVSKFVFVHQLIGGIDKQGRGGVEAAPFREWGGRNADGSDGFKEHRPGWDAPIHQLLVRNHATIVFHGHDHLFAKQDLDGIVYQEVPQPGLPGLGNPRIAAEYGYVSGTILGGAGHMRVTVSPAQVKVEYVRAFLPAEENGQRKNGQVGHTYTIAPLPDRKESLDR